MNQIRTSHLSVLEYVIHIISWVLIFGFPLIFMSSDGDGVHWWKFLMHCTVPLCFFTLFYVNYIWLVPHHLFDGRPKPYLLSNALLTVCLLVLLHFGQEMLSTLLPPRPEGKLLPPRWLFLLRDGVMMIFVVGLATAIRTGLRWRETEERLSRAEREKTEAELCNLKNQLNPHFLLNTLNNIYALIAFDSEQAQAAVRELSRLLRYVLYENNNDLVPLEKEYDFIHSYVELMRIRLAPDTTTVELQLESEDSIRLQVAPLLFISLIENAFKHGISPQGPNYISIRITGRADGSIYCCICNSNHPKDAHDKSGSGIGLEQVRRRLELIYPSRYEWHEYVNAEGKYVSELTIQTNS